MKVDNRLSRKRVLKYLNITKRALENLKISVPKKSHAWKMAEDFLLMAKSYYSDAEHFYEKGKLTDAFACVNYAHGWLDAGARIGLFDVSAAEKLFTV